MSQTNERDVVASVQASVEDSPLAQLVIGSDGWVRAASSRACELLGVPSGFRAAPLTTAITAASAVAVLDFVGQVCRTGLAVSFADDLWVPVAGGQWQVSGGIVPLRDETGAVVAAAVTVDASGAQTGLQPDNEELRRDNTELRSIADELRTRTDELNVVALFLQSVLTSLRGAVVVVDTSLVVRVWNAEAERLWGIPRRVAMHGRLPELDLGFGQDLIARSIDAGLRGDVSDDIAVDLRRPGGELAAYTVSVTPLLGPGATVHGVTLLFVERRLV